SRMPVDALLFTISSNASAPTYTSTLSLHDALPIFRRARLKFDGFAYSPKLRYKIELGFSGPDMDGASEFTGHAPNIIFDAVVMWEFYKNFKLWVGQTKLPGNRERVISSGNMQFIDRSILNSNFNIDRDVGFQLRHQFNASKNFVIREILAVSQGEGRNVITGNLGGHQYTGRLEVLPRSEEHTSELQSRENLVCRLLLEKKNTHHR